MKNLLINPGIIKRIKTFLTGKYVEDGNTASQNIPAGKWVIWKNQMCQAKTAITTGDTLSSTNLDVQGDDGAVNALNSKLTPVLLWENLNPSSAFAAQEIQVPNLSDYMFIAIEHRIRDSAGNKYKKIDSFVVADQYSAYAWLDNTGATNYCINFVRGFTISKTNNSITFENGDRQNTTGSHSKDNTVAIPYKIYGLFRIAA